MPEIAELIHRNSERFLPAFARLRMAEETAAGHHDDMEFHFVGPHPVPGPGERELKRWVVIGGGMFVATDDGEPIGTAGGQGQLLTLFTGGAEVVLTDRRLLALVIDGQTVVGPVGDRCGFMMVITFPLHRIESVSVDRKRGFLGGVKETRITVMSTTPLAALVFDDVIAETGPGPRGFQRFRGSRREIVEAFAAPVVSARLPQAAPKDLSQLRAVERGARLDESDEFGIAFVAD
jgi:hypothetical protein